MKILNSMITSRMARLFLGWIHLGLDWCLKGGGNEKSLCVYWINGRAVRFSVLLAEDADVYFEFSTSRLRYIFLLPACVFSWKHENRNYFIKPVMCVLANIEVVVMNAFLYTYWVYHHICNNMVLARSVHLSLCLSEMCVSVCMLCWMVSPHHKRMPCVANILVLSTKATKPTPFIVIHLCFFVLL